ncbi:MAG TPA: hypothetical protein VGF67_27980 [Ktedonobacteraceae bacterium]
MTSLLDYRLNCRHAPAVILSNATLTSVTIGMLDKRLNLWAQGAGDRQMNLRTRLRSGACSVAR